MDAGRNRINGLILPGPRAEIAKARRDERVRCLQAVLSRKGWPHDDPEVWDEAIENAADGIRTLQPIGDGD